MAGNPAGWTSFVVDSNFNPARWLPAHQSFGRRKMHIPSLIKYAVLAWGVPILIVVVVRVFTPDPSLTRTEFSQLAFKPVRVWVTEKKGRKNSDYFELRMQNPNGEEFFYRDPEREPILDLYGRLPKDVDIKILFSPGAEGNVLMEVAAINPLSAPVLAFESVMDKYSSRRRVVYIVAAVWCCIANFLAYALWKVNFTDPAADQTKINSFKFESRQRVADNISHSES